MSTQFSVRTFKKIEDNQNLSPLLERIYGARGITSVKQLDYSLKQLLDPNDIINLSDTAQFLSQKIKQNKHILIVGDYDSLLYN